MKKIALTLACLMACTTLFTGCGGSSDQANEENGQVTLTMISADGGRINKPDNDVLLELEKRTGVNLEVTLVPQSEFKNKFNVMVASASTPDIMRTNGYDFFDYIPQNAFMDITELVETYGTDIREKIPQEAWDKILYEGKLYGIPHYNVPGKVNMLARKDWMDKLGIDTPTTLDEYRDMLLKFTYDDPDGNGQDDTYGMSTSGEINSDAAPETFVNIFGAFGIMPGFYHEKDGKVFPAFIAPEYKEALTFLRQLYVEDKVIDPDLFIVKTDQARQNLVQGKSGSYTGWWSVAPQVLMTQLKMDVVNPEAEWTIIPPISGPNGAKGTRAGNLVNGVTSIASNCKHPEEAMKLLNYMGSDEGAMLVNLGLEGKHYTVDENGQFVSRTEEGQKAMDEKWIDYLSQIVARVDVTNMIYRVNDPETYVHMEAAAEAEMYHNLFEGYTTEETQKNNASLQKLELEWLVKFVTGAEPLDKFDEYVDTWLNKGGREVLQSLVDVYNERNGTNYVSAY